MNWAISPRLGRGFEKLRSSRKLPDWACKTAAQYRRFARLDT